MPEVYVRFQAIIDKYTPELGSFTEEQLDELAWLAAGLHLALEYSRFIEEDKQASLENTLALLSVVFEMGKQSGGLVLNVVEEVAKLYAEREPNFGEIYEEAMLTPSQAEVKNHINSLAGLTRRWE